MIGVDVSICDMVEIERTRLAIGAEAGRFGSVGDAVPHDLAADAFGTLSNAARLATAVNALCGLLRTEYAHAESLVGAIERTLDANLTNIATNEHHIHRAFSGLSAINQQV